eukprot:364569-Chlamydomonas_euryale.AAC.24
MDPMHSTHQEKSSRVKTALAPRQGSAVHAHPHPHPYPHAHAHAMSPSHQGHANDNRVQVAQRAAPQRPHPRAQSDCHKHGEDETRLRVAHLECVRERRLPRHRRYHRAARAQRHRRIR